MRTKRQKSDIKSKIKKAKDLPIETKVVLYGKAGTGKTTLANTFPEPVVFLDCSEKGTDSIRDSDADVIQCETFEDIEQMYWMLKKGKHKYKTVVIDTVSQAQDLAIRDHLSSLGKSVTEGEMGNWGTMRKQDWGSVATMMKDIIHNFRDLPYNIVFIAHDRSFNMGDEDEESTLMPYVGPNLMPSVASVLNASVSIIGNTFLRNKITVTKKKIKGKIKKIEKKRLQYCLRIGPNELFITKIRKPKKFQIPDVMVDPSHEDIVELISGME